MTGPNGAWQFVDAGFEWTARVLLQESLFCSSTMRENMENEEDEDFEVGDEYNRGESSYILQYSHILLFCFFTNPPLYVDLKNII